MDSSPRLDELLARSRASRDEHRRWLLELTNLPTAAGREDRAIEWVERWVAQRDRLALSRDEAGNLVISRRERRDAGEGPILFTAHLDHPAFVIDSVGGAEGVVASFLGGVHEPYFSEARVEAHARSGERLAGTIVRSEAPDSSASPARLFRRCEIELDDSGGADLLAPGDVMTWALPDAETQDGHLLAPACDDLAAVAAALSAMDVLCAGEQEVNNDVRVLLTRAEEVGFVGAIAACKLGTIPRGSRLIALENSRSFADSPIGGGPIVRVGDRLSTFSPTLTAGVAKVAQNLAGEPERKVAEVSAHVGATGFKWQRKLMPGGACEATAFAAYGHEATCLCLPLGNYHNMGDLDRVQEALQKGEKNVRASVAPERISLDDYHGLVDLLVGCGASLDQTEPLIDRMEKLYAERAFVLG